MTGTCKTCQFWRLYDSGHGRAFNYCDAVDDGPLAANSPATAFSLDVTAADDHGLAARLVTGPEFGCVHHEPAAPDNTTDEWPGGLDANGDPAMNDANRAAHAARVADSLRALLDTATRKLLDARRAVAYDRSWDIAGAVRSALAEGNALRTAGGLDPVPPASVEEYPGQLTDET